MIISQVREVSAKDQMEYQFDVSVPQADIEAAIDTRAKTMARGMRVNGFRPGKVPASVAKERHGGVLREQVFRNIIADQVKAIINKGKLDVIDQPRVELKAFQKDLDFSVYFYRRPEIEEIDFSTLTLEHPQIDIGQLDVDSRLQQLVRERPQFTSVKTKIKISNKHHVLFDYSCQVEGKGDPVTQESVPFQMGRKDLGPLDAILTRNLKSKTKGDVLHFDFTFDKDDSNTAMAGKKSSFEVTIRDVGTTSPSRVDDVMAKELGTDDVEGLRKAIKVDIEKRCALMVSNFLRRGLIKVLSGCYHFDVPRAWIAEETERQEQGAMGDKPLTSAAKKIAKEEVIYRLRLGIVITDIARQHGLVVSQSDINAALSEQARRFPGESQSLIESYNKDKTMQKRLHGRLLEDKVLDFILTKIQKKKKTISWSDFEASYRIMDQSQSPVKRSVDKAKPVRAAATKNTGGAKDGAKPVRAVATKNTGGAKDGAKPVRAAATKNTGGAKDKAKPVRAAATKNTGGAKDGAKPVRAAATKRQVKA